MSGRRRGKQQNNEIAVLKLAVHKQRKELSLSYRRISSGEVILQQTFYPVMATVKEREVKLFQTYCGLVCLTELLIYF